MAFLFSILLKILVVTGVVNNSMSANGVGYILMNMLVLTIQFNVVFGIFNLIPIPPFDGSRILYFFMPRKGKEIMDYLERYSFIIILIIFFTNIGTYMVSPIVNFVLFLLTKFIIM